MVNKAGDDDVANSLMSEFGDPPEGQYLDFDENGNVVNIPLHMREERAAHIARLTKTN